MPVMQVKPVIAVTALHQDCPQALLAAWLLADDRLQAPFSGVDMRRFAPRSALLMCAADEVRRMRV